MNRFNRPRRNVWWQIHVERPLQSVRAMYPVKVKSDNLTGGVNAAVRPTRADNGNRPFGNGFKSAF
jgi:hypothetical protein